MKTNTLRALIAGSAMLPAAVFAVGSPAGTTFGEGTDWTMTGGVITHVCPAGYTCDANPISDTEFLQVQMTDGAGNSFFRTIVASGEGTGVEQFRTESFVVAGGTNGGIATQQTLASPDVPLGAGTMAAVSTINSGSFGPGAGATTVNLAQDVNSGLFNTGFKYDATIQANGDSVATLQLAQSNSDTDYIDNFRYDQNTSITGGTVSIDGKAIDITSTVTLKDNASVVIGDQSFGYTQREGNLMTAVTGGATLDVGSGAGSSITWTGASAVERVLVGQTMSGIGSFGYERLADVDAVAGNEQISTFDLTTASGLDTLGADPFSPALVGIDFGGTLPLIP